MNTSPQSKMNVIAEKLNIRIDKGKRPFQTVDRLLKFRNDVAHGKSLTPNSDKEKSISDFDPHGPLESKWEQYCTLDNAKRARDDAWAIIE